MTPYPQYLRRVMYLLTAGLSREQIATLAPDVLSHIGEGYRRKWDVRVTAALIIADTKVPPILRERAWAVYARRTREKAT